MKKCELCNGLARIYCESDHANLCWECDLNVHSANFLVERHSRSLLCHVCQLPTAWSAAGAKIGRAVCICERCANNERIGGDENETIDNNDEVEEIDLEDIQVVLWSSTLPPPPSSSSSSDESMNSDGSFSSKRMREDDDDSGTSLSHREVDEPPPAVVRGGDEAAAIVDSFSTCIRTPLKIKRT